MVSCAAKLFRHNRRDETFGAENRVISTYGKYGSGDSGRTGAPRNVFRGIAFGGPAPTAVVRGARSQDAGLVGWAKAQSAVPTISRDYQRNGGHASLCPPYSTSPCR
nr:hypothetical protein BDOA9_0115490 [Bradyrhizobium sp. DOA9]